MAKNRYKRHVINNATLEIKNFTLQRGDRLLVRELSLALKSGDVLELRGANGSGKTTLLRAIAGLHQAISGSITFTGNDDFENKDYIGFMGHLDAIKPNETISQQLAFWAKFFGNNTAQISDIAEQLKISRILPLMGISLSAGQRRRVAIARIIIANRPIWLLDEPAAPLDNDGRKVLGEILNTHSKKGGVIIAAVHDALPCMGAKQLHLDDLRVVSL